MRTLCVSAVLLVLGVAWAAGAPTAANYLVGAGKADITGPASDVNMMGYAKPTQQAHGIHFRLFSRAFIIEDLTPGGKRVVFVSIDACMGTQIMRMRVLDRLKEKYGDLYNNDNLCISGIHTHSGPAGYFQYVLFEITSLGFVKESLDAIVDGIVLSISRAHDNLTPGKITVNLGELTDASINRSPSAYLGNPAWERAMYKYNTDKNVTQIHLTAADGTPVGLINWFAVHCVSMNNNNTLISGDNKGYASMLFERQMNKGRKGAPFVAAFAQSNEGDVTPNTGGTFCMDSGLPCDFNTSTCHGRNELCIAKGPGVDDFDNTRIIGQKQFNKAWELFNAPPVAELSGPVDFRHQFIEMGKINITVNGTVYQSCKPSMGDSFAAGTTDGPGAFNFYQGDTSGNPFWDQLVYLLRRPTKEQKDCQHPKPIFLDTGEIEFPYPWQPTIVDTQVLRIGQLFILAVPSEFTTMAGRRTRDAVRNVLGPAGLPTDFVVIAGLANTYSDYTVTYDEYQIQRYEGASTTHGPHTHRIYTAKMVELTEAILAGKPVDPGPPAPDYQSKQISLLPGVIVDTTPLGTHFGDVFQGPHASYKTGENVSVIFWSANPRVNLRLEGTFTSVERQQSGSQDWEVVYTDADWETRFHWFRPSLVPTGHSHANITWTIPSDYEGVGLQHRIQHFGTSKSITGTLTDFTGTSPTFLVTK